jgi:hypothetical protein
MHAGLGRSVVFLIATCARLCVPRRRRVMRWRAGRFWERRGVWHRFDMNSRLADLRIGAPKVLAGIACWALDVFTKRYTLYGFHHFTKC